MGVTFAATSSSQDAPEIEEGTYDAVFTGIKVKFVEGGIYGDGDRFEWAFNVYVDGDPIPLTVLTSMSLNITSKTTPNAVKYLKALSTKAEFDDFLAGGTPDSSALVGRKCKVSVETKENGWPKIASVTK